MKPLYASVSAILTALAIIGMVTVGTQQVYGPRTCPNCGEFKALSHDFIKEVIEAGEEGDTDEIQRLLGEYSDDVTEIFSRSPPPEPD